MRGLTWKFCLIYLDDIIVFSPTFEDHLHHLRQVLDRLRTANLKLKPSKCFFAKREIRYLGHVVNQQGIQPDPGKVTAVKNYPTPCSLRGTGMIASSSTFRPHPGRVIRDLFRLLDAVTALYGSTSLQQSSKGSCSLLVSGYNLRGDCQWRTLVPPLNSGANAAPASVMALMWAVVALNNRQ